MIALGELGLHPWDFGKYTMEEFELKLEGHRESLKEQWYHTRSICFHIARYAGMTAKNPRMTQEQFWPLFGEKPKGGRLSTITDPAERRKAALEMRQRFIEAGWIKSSN